MDSDAYFWDLVMFDISTSNPLFLNAAFLGFFVGNLLALTCLGELFQYVSPACELSVSQAFQESTLENLDQRLSSMLLAGMPGGGFQGLHCEKTPGRGTTPWD